MRKRECDLITQDINMNEVELLMQEYFKNKDKLKALKYERMLYGAVNKCYADRSQPPCYMKDGYEFDDFCEICKVKHKLFLEVKKLAHRNKGILLRVRGLTKEKDK